MRSCVDAWEEQTAVAQPRHAAGGVRGPQELPRATLSRLRKLATFVTKKPAKRAMSSPSLVPEAVEEVPLEELGDSLDEEMELTESLGHPLWKSPTQGDGGEIDAPWAENEGQPLARNCQYYPHPSLQRGRLKMSRPRAMAYGIDPGKARQRTL